MNTLRNVDEIDAVFKAGDSRENLEDVAEIMNGYDFQDKLDSLYFLSKNLKEPDIPDTSDVKWEFYKSYESSDSVSFVRKGANFPTMFAFVWFNSDSNATEIGISYKQPQSAWIGLAKNEYDNDDEEWKKEINERDNIDSDNDDVDKNSVDKNSVDKSHIGSKKERIPKQSNSHSIDKTDTEMSKKQLKILIKSRLSNVLHANDSFINSEKNELSDYYFLNQGYPQVVPILKDIFDENSLRKNIHRLPYDFSDSEIDMMINEANKINTDSDKSSDTSEINDSNELEYVFEK